MPRSIPTICGSMMAHPFSLGVKIHTAAYKALGLDYTFVCFGVEDPEQTVKAVRTLGIRGMNVSMPYKSAVIPFLDRLDEAAEHIGAVNTIDNRDGLLTGYNTDYIGAVRALEEVSELNGYDVAVLGAGGAARAIAYGVKAKGAAVTILNRTRKRGEELAATLGIRFGGDLNDFAASQFSILVNATPIGMHAPDESPVDKLESHLIVMDAVFLPRRTKLLREAEAIGCRTIEGTRMLLHQACGQVELYTGKEAPLAVMEQVLIDEMEKMNV